MTPKPISFTQTPDDYDGPLPEQFAIVGGLPGAGEPVAVAWADVTGKPATFPPASHTHTVANVTGLQAILDDYESRIAALEATGA